VILTISSTGPNAGDLSFLFHKHPERVQEFALSFGRVLVFYPRYEATVCEIALVLDLDPLRLVGRGERVGLPLYPYVNDRPYVASSFLSVALSEVFKSAMNGQCKTVPATSARSGPWLCESSPWASKLWNALSGGNRCVGSMNAFSGFWRSRASRSTRDCKVDSRPKVPDWVARCEQKTGWTPILSLLSGVLSDG
jgi:hypothetical protein